MAAVLLLAVLVFIAGALGRERASSTLASQNVILVLADDMRYDSVWVMSSLLKLAERGTTFTNAHVTTPLCCPSRASILTGLYTRQHGVLSNNPPDGGVEVFDDRSTVATWLHASGVRTGLIGKYLNGYLSHDIPPGWDFWFATGAEQYSGYYDIRVTDNGERREFGRGPEHYSTRVYAQQAMAFLGQERERPFFLFLAPRAPHDPAIPDPQDRNRFSNVELPLPPSYDEEDLSDKPAMFRGLRRLTASDHEELDKHRRRQLESLLSVDRAIDGIVQALEADGRLDRTWIIFTSDNGVTLGEHRRLQSKSCAYEECVHVPLIVIPPAGVEVPRTLDHLVANVDLAPTIAAILGAEPTMSVSGRSFLPLLREPGTPWRDGLMLEHLQQGSPGTFVAIRTADRKYVRYSRGEEELYDLVADPHELESRALDPTWSAPKAELRERLRVLVEEVGPPVTGRRLP